MSAIVISPARVSGDALSTLGPEDHMPIHTRILVARELNRAWREFVTDMHDGPTTGNDVAEKFWKFVTGT